MRTLGYDATVSGHVGYWHGDAMVYTGQTQILNGGRFYEFRLTEGHRIGETGWTMRRPGQLVADLDGKSE